MPLLKKGNLTWDFSKLTVSYRVRPDNKAIDARNVLTNQGVLETRPGYSRYNATQIEAGFNIVSLSDFTDMSGNLIPIAKCNTSLYKVNTTGAATAIKTGLTLNRKHRAVNFRDRHLIAAGDDGLFQYDGTTFTQIGQSVPTAPTVAASGSGQTLTASDYQVAVTFYSSTTGFETNIGAASSTVTVSSGQQIDVSAIPSTANNGTIDKVRIYLKDVTNNSNYLFWAELDLGTTTDTIDDDPTSTQTPPTTNGAPPTNPKYIAVFGKSIAYSGDSTFPSDVFISEAYLPDAVNRTSTAKTIFAGGKGPITGIGVGFFNDSELLPFLCIFKRNSIEVYSEVQGTPELSQISNSIGCIANDTIVEEGGVVYFMSTTGWFAIENGRLRKHVKDGQVTPREIANDDLLDIFTRAGYNYELNKSNFSNFFSVFYPTLKNYMTFVTEGVGTTFTKCYNYEFEANGFRPLEFAINFYSATKAQTSDGEDIVLLGGSDGYVYKYSIAEDKTDVDADNASVNISTFIDLFYFQGDDYESSYNYGPLSVRAVQGENDVTVAVYIDYEINASQDFSFSKDTDGFILDVSLLDVGLLSDNRSIVRYIGEILRTGQSMFLKFSQRATNSNIGLIEGQVHVSKNGSPN